MLERRALRFRAEGTRWRSATTATVEACPPGELADVALLSLQYRIPTVALDEYVVEPAILALVPKELCVAHRVLPISLAGGSLVLAMVDPFDSRAVAAAEAHTNRKVEPVIASEAAVVEAIAMYYP